MRVIDTHCDVLYKLQKSKRLNFKHSSSLQCSKKRLEMGNVLIQFFAVFINPQTPTDKAWEDTIDQIGIYYNSIIGKNKNIIPITKWKDIKKVKDGEIGAVLTLEGADGFGNDLNKLRILHRLGVMSIGLTWNHANLCADGVGEPRGGGLTLLGQEVVKRNNERRVLTDVSHLSEKGFWDVVDIADYPIASHSNTKTVCNHPRNLNDEQINALIKKDAQIHLVFYPPFVKEHDKVTSSHLLKHIDHICSLGGSKNIGFGSDFDGIDQTLTGLENASKYPDFINELSNYYSEEEVRGFCSENFLRYLTVKNLK